MSTRPEANFEKQAKWLSRFLCLGGIAAIGAGFYFGNVPVMVAGAMLEGPAAAAKVASLQAEHFEADK